MRLALPRIIARRLVAAALLSGLAALPGPAAAGYTGLRVFGDSLSDRGNLALATGGLAPASPTYSGGNFSNGPSWSNALSQRLGLGPSVPSLAGGTVHAFGFARTDNVAPGFGLPEIINIPGQVSAYIAGPATPGALFAMWGGANNLLQALAAAPLQPNPQAYLLGEAASAAGGVLAQLGRLHADGARHFLVLNLPDLGATPRFAAEPLAAAAGRATTQAFNSVLAAGLAGFGAQPGVRLHTLDIFQLFERIQSTPAPFGFDNTAMPCVAGLVPDIYVNPAAASIVCTPAQAARSVFWDPIHPTAAAHELIGALAAAAVPVPGGLALLLLPAGLLVVLRRRV